MPNFVQQVFHVHLVEETFQVSVPTPTTFSVACVDETFSVAMVTDSTSTVNVAVVDEIFHVHVAEAIQFNVQVNLPDQLGGSGGPVSPSDLLQEGATLGQAIVWNGTIWAPATVAGSGAVDSVFGRTGAVVATLGDYTTDLVTEASNLYFTDARVAANAAVAANTAHKNGNGSDHADVALNTTHRGIVTGNPHSVTLADVGGASVVHSHVATDVTDFTAAVDANLTVVANAAHAALVLGNPHMVTLADVGGAAASHTHHLSDLEQDGAAANEVILWNDIGSTWSPSTLNTSIIDEGTNLYYTEDRVTANVTVAANAVHAALTAGNPHGVTLSDVGGAAASHAHDLTDLNQTGATLGQVIYWNGSTWTPTTLSSTAPVDSVNGQTGIVVLAYGDVGAAAAVHTHAVGDLTQSGAALDQVIAWNGSAWAPAAAGAAPVDSVNGETGVVVLDTDDIGEGTALYFTEARANAASDVAANTSARHSHANKAQLDLVTDGDHDVRVDNPHGVTAAQAGAAATSHGHALSDLTQSAATTGQAAVWNGSTWAPADLAFHPTTNAIYVDPDGGNDTTGTGSFEKPYATIQKSINEATSGEVVLCLSSGDFAEDVTCTDGVDIVAPYSDLTLDSGDQLTLAACRVTLRRLIRTTGTGAMVMSANATGCAILNVFEVVDDGSGDTLSATNSAPLDFAFSQAFIGNGNAFLADDSTARHVHLRGEDIYLTAANTTAIELSGGSTVLMTVHHTKELGSGIGSGRVFNITDGDVNASFQEVGATTLADIAADGNLNIAAQQASGTVTNAGVYTYVYNELSGATYIGSNLGVNLDGASYKLNGLAGNDGAFLTLGSTGLLVPTTLNVGAVNWNDETEAFTDVSTTTEETVYEVTVDQDVDAGNIEFELNITFPYWRTSTVRLYHEATLLDTQTYTGSGSPLVFTGGVPIDFTVTSGDTFTVTFQTDVAPAWEPNRSDIADGGFLQVNKTGNEATAAWGGITGTISDQTDLMGEFLSRTNTDVFVPTANYHPATKKYVDDLTYTDHGALSGLADDDHLQYHNDTRGDLRYALLSHNHVAADVTDFEAAVTANVTVAANAAHAALVAGNPHMVTLADVGGAAAVHGHAASEITAGTFPTGLFRFPDGARFDDRILVYASDSATETVGISLNSATFGSLPAYGIGMAPTSSEGYIVHQSGVSASSLFGHRFKVAGVNILEIQGDGLVGINNDTPTSALDVIGDFGVTGGITSSAGALDVFGSSVFQNALQVKGSGRFDSLLWVGHSSGSSGSVFTVNNINTNTPVTVSGTNYRKNQSILTNYMPISSGVVDSGYRVGLAVEGYLNGAEFEGTLDRLYGIWSRVGANGTAPTGTINSAASIYVDTLTGANVTINNLYGVYQPDAGDTVNYFAGTTGIGTDPNVTARTEDLQVGADAWIGGDVTSETMHTETLTVQDDDTSSTPTLANFITLHRDAKVRIGYATGDYGFHWKYLGSGTGVNNSLEFYAENQTGTNIRTSIMNQSGEITHDTDQTFDGDLQFNGLTSGLVHTKMIYIDVPTATDSFPVFAVPVACTITRIAFSTSSGNVSFNLEERPESSPGSSGTDVFAAPDFATSTPEVITSFANASLAANSWLYYTAATVNAPGKLWIKITYVEG